MSDSDRQGLRRRFDARLDAYLRRTLSPQDHDRVSTSVKCVASLTGDIQNKHRYAILGHRCVYFADVPPKNVKVAIHLRDVQSVQMVRGKVLCSHGPIYRASVYTAPPLMEYDTLTHCMYVTVRLVWYCKP